MLLLLADNDAEADNLHQTSQQASAMKERQRKLLAKIVLLMSMLAKCILVESCHVALI